ncbi:MAG TPA: MFS transporter [Thermoleophilaceae bacterium]|nr:MFS transporter [Thermoleophilaceae bacterium]
MRELLRQPRTRLFLAAHAQSTLGTGAGYVALLLLAYDRFRSPWAITLVLLADFLPSMLLGPVLGAVVDRGSRKAAAVLSDLARAAAFISIAFVGSFELTVALALLAGTGTALYRPAVMAALPSLAPRERQPALTSAYGAIEDLGHTAGPALAAAGLLVLPASTVVAIDGATFLVSAFVVSRIDFGSRPMDAPAGALLRAVREGIAVARRVPGVPTVVIASSSVVLFAGLFNVGELLLATGELGAGASGFSLLVAIYGAGAVGGSLVGSRGGGVPLLRRRYALGIGCVGAGMLAAGVAPGYAAALGSFLLAGIGNGLVVVHERLLLQEALDDSLLGRVFGLKDALSSWAFGTAFICAGALTSLLGVRALFILAGAGGLAVCTWAVLSFRAIGLGDGPGPPVSEPDGAAATA